MKEDDIYPYYIIYLENRLTEGNLSNGYYQLMKISKSAFDDYKYRFDTDELFNKRQLELYKSEDRDKKIDNLLDYETLNEI